MLSNEIPKACNKLAYCSVPIKTSCFATSSQFSSHKDEFVQMATVDEAEKEKVI